MKITKYFPIILFPFYYLMYFIQQQYIFLIIAFIILFKLFLIDKYVNLVQLFFVILPEILSFELSSYFKTTFEFINGVYIYTFIDPVFIASLFCLFKTIITKNTAFNNFLRLLLLIIFIFHFYQLITLVSNIENIQGLTYGVKSLLYFNAIFLVNQIQLEKLKKELLTIIEISLILFSTKLFLGHYYFYIATFPIIYFKIKKNILSIIIMVWIYFLIIQGLEMYTAIAISLMSFIVIASNSYNYFLRKNLFLFFVLNFSIIFYLFLIYLNPFLTEFINNNFLEIKSSGNAFIQKILLDRLPLFLAATDQSNYIFGNFSHIDLEGYSNTIKTDNDWGYGVHNYFLNMHFKIGLLSTLIIFLIINNFFFNIAKYLKKLDKESKNNNLYFFKIFITASLIFYWIWSFTGNSFSEPVGFFFFLIIGTVYSSLKKNSLKD